MTVRDARAGRPGLLAEVTMILRDITGEDEEWAAGVTPASTLDGDLALDSLELAALAAALGARYGPGVDLAAYAAGLDIDGLIRLSVADLVALVEARAR